MGPKLDECAVCSSDVGPGHYNIHTEPVSGPAYTIAGKQSLVQKDQFETPGPGQYALKPKAIQGGSPAYTFAGCGLQSVKEIEGNPGPGDYETESNSAKGPAFSLGIKQDTHVPNSDAPGDCMP